MIISYYDACPQQQHMRMICLRNSRQGCQATRPAYATVEKHNWSPVTSPVRHVRNYRHPQQESVGRLTYPLSTRFWRQ